MNTAEINDLGDALEQAADQAFEETMDDINDEYAVSDEERFLRGRANYIC